jgi:hypothetical protein
MFYNVSNDYSLNMQQYFTVKIYVIRPTVD